MPTLKRLAQVYPRLPVDDVVHRAVGHAKDAPEGAVSLSLGCARANFQDLCVRKFVIALQLAFSAISVSKVAKISGLASCVKVSRVAAQTVITVMKDIGPRRNRSVREHVRQPVGLERGLAQLTHSENAVTVRVNGSLPFPTCIASSSIDARPKTGSPLRFGLTKGSRGTVQLHSLVVKAAKASPVMFTVAVGLSANSHVEMIAQ